MHQRWDMKPGEQAPRREWCSLKESKRRKGKFSNRWHAWSTERLKDTVIPTRKYEDAETVQEVEKFETGTDERPVEGVVQRY